MLLLYAVCEYWAVEKDMNFIAQYLLIAVNAYSLMVVDSGAFFI